MTISGAELQTALLGEAESNMRTRSVGFATLAVDRLGGIDAIQPAIDELRAAGIKVDVSAGAQDRFVHLPDIRLTA
jgi:hypothetical protein